MDYNKLDEINQKLRKTNIKGKDYVEVNERVKAFWQLFENGRILTDIVSLENGMCVIRASVYSNREDNLPIATGIAYEKEGSSFINSTSFIENCETSAIGRALGNVGIGIDTSIASAEEVQNAQLQQEGLKKITSTQETALRTAIEERGIETDVVVGALNKLQCKKLGDLKLKDLTEFRKEVGLE